MSVRKKGSVRKRQERRERYISNIDINRERQRAYARERRRESREVATYHSSCRDWDTIPFHARFLVLVVWDSRRRAFKGIHGYGLGTDFHPNHGRNPSANAIYRMYQWILAHHTHTAPLDFPRICDLLGRLVAGGWIEITRDGYTEDGMYVFDYDTLFQPTFPAGYVRNRLQSGIGDDGDVIRNVAEACTARCDREAADMGVEAVKQRSCT